MLTAGQDHDLACAEPLLENTNPGAVIADKAYDADALIDKLTKQGTTPVIPPKANREDQRECDFALYCERNLIERFFNKIKHFRGIATRYDKLARNYPAGRGHHPDQLKTGPSILPAVSPRSSAQANRCAR
jgi:transposase